MTTSLQNPADVVNAALTRMGYELSVGTLYDGSKAARNALNIYGQTRDEMLRDGNWKFAERNATLALLKSAPTIPGGYGYIPPIVWSSTYPPLPWIFEYAWPDDCLKVRAIKAVPLIIPNIDPQPVIYGIENDNSLVPPAKVILCNVQDAAIVYTGRVTDPITWEPDFTEALVAALEQRLVAGLKDAQQIQVAAADAAQTKQIAERQNY